MSHYNGWSNRETWLVYTWFNPETAEDIEFIREQVEQDWDSLPDYMRDFCDINSIDWDRLLEAVQSGDDNDDETEGDEA